MALSPFSAQNPPTAQNFVTRGLLPANLPSVVTSRELAAPYSAEGDRYLVTQGRSGKLATYDATKRGEQRRHFEIPHPLFVRDAGLFYQKHWPEIWQHINRSVGSASKPMQPKSLYRAITMASQTKVNDLKIRELAAKRYCLVTDISRCYPTIYTHTIPWALHGKDVAKIDRSERSAQIWGNRLDFIHRQAQDGQTIGIPVGPDISRITAEIILSAIDQEYLQNGRRKTKYVRHVDDYWIGGDSIDDCEKKLNDLRAGLNFYQLDINESKTRIVELSEVTGQYWPDDLAKQIESTFRQENAWGGLKRIAQTDAHDLFSRAINIVRTTHDTAILKFLIRKMDKSRVWKTNWKLVEPYLAHIAVQFPHVFDYVARVLAWAVRQQISVDRPLWREVIGTVSKTSADHGRDGELLWALWVYKELGFKVPQSLISKAILNNGPVPLSFAAHMATDGLITNRDFFNNLRERVSGSDQYNGVDWPITLELFHLQEANEIRRRHPLQGSHIQSPFASECSMIRYNAYPEVFYEERENRDDFDIEDADFEFPDHAIEDFTSSYDDEDEDDEDDDDEEADLPF